MTKPKINKGSRIPLIKPAMIIILAGLLASPVARIALLPVIGITNKGIAMYHTAIYSWMIGSKSALAPIKGKSGSIVSQPTVEPNTIKITASNKPCVVSLAALLVSPLPSKRPMLGSQHSFPCVITKRFCRIVTPKRLCH